MYRSFAVEHVEASVGAERPLRPPLSLTATRAAGLLRRAQLLEVLTGGAARLARTAIVQPVLGRRRGTDLLFSDEHLAVIRTYSTSDFERRRVGSASGGDMPPL